MVGDVGEGPAHAPHVGGADMIRDAVPGTLQVFRVRLLQLRESFVREGRYVASAVVGAPPLADEASALKVVDESGDSAR